MSSEADERKPVLTPDQAAEGWRVVKQGGMWVKTLDLGKVPLRLGQRDPEIVICSAIRLCDGRIFRGHRHHDCIRTAGDALGERRFPHDQGFITSRNRYVDRKEGLALQLAAGIASVSKRGYGSGLFSEDLY